MTKHEIEITVNGRKRRLTVKPNDLLLNVIRDDMILTGTKYGCGIGECAACTVLMEGKPVLACMILAVAAHGKNITTIEGLADGDQLAPIQQAFIDHGAIQCGFCTPGMVLTSQALLNENPDPSEKEIKDYLRGNHCRCTGYASIVKAVQSCAKKK
ncbi:MAG: (2Fe-2S)-binding protein [Bacillota bacterium]|jgi:aerobic-type carbon monoxide dehydrogenase small subunit (CoxS/CutS family)